VTSVFLKTVDVDFGLHAYWYLGRAGGFVAFAVLIISMMLGMAISSRLFDGLLARAWFFELHKFVSMFLVAAVVFHAFVMLPDPYANFTVEELLIPFRSHINPVPLAAGIFALYGLVILNLSFYVTRWIGQKMWRRLHYLTFATYGAGLVHGIWAGTDSDLLEARYFYLGTAIAVAFFVLYRASAARSQKKRSRRSGVEARPVIAQ
jgi:predicted ferric reductase